MREGARRAGYAALWWWRERGGRVPSAPLGAVLTGDDEPQARTREELDQTSQQLPIPGQSWRPSTS